MAVVSLIMPIYNVSSCVEPSLKSALSQRYGDMEYILVDDCGTDDSMDIVMRIKGEYPNKNIRILKHTHNRGLSAARNTGLAAASGEYVFFMDSDDLITPDCIAEHVAAIEKYDADFTDAGIEVIGGRNIFSTATDYIYLNNTTDLLKSYFNGRLHISAWNKLVKRSFLCEHRLLFTEGLIYEDVEWLFHVSQKAKALVVIPQTTYQYIIRKKSITTHLTSRHIESRIYLNKMIASYIDTCKDPALCRLAKYFLTAGRFKTSSRVLLGETLNFSTKKTYYEAINACEFAKHSAGIYSVLTRLPFWLFYALFYLPRRVFAFMTSL